jgi:hypothetical protein
MTKPLIPLAILATLVAGAAVALFTVGGSAEEQPPASSDSIAEGDCSLVHNLDACDTSPAGEPAGEQPPIRSDEGIDPDECNTVHNIDACSPEELEDFGLTKPADGEAPVTSGDEIAPDECSLVHNLEAC